MNNVIAGPWVSTHKRAPGGGKTRHRVAQETIHTIPSSLSLPLESSVIADSLLEEWVEFMKSCGDEKSWHWTLKSANTRYKIRFTDFPAGTREVYGGIEAFHADSGVKRVYIGESDSLLDSRMKEAVQGNVGKLVKGKIAPEFEGEMVFEIENQLGYLDQSTPVNGFKYGEHHLVHKFRWWRLIYRSELTRQRIQG